MRVEGLGLGGGLDLGSVLRPSCGNLISVPQQDPQVSGVKASGFRARAFLGSGGLRACRLVGFGTREVQRVQRS